MDFDCIYKSYYLDVYHFCVVYHRTKKLQKILHRKLLQKH